MHLLAKIVLYLSKMHGKTTIKKSDDMTEIRVQIRAKNFKATELILSLWTEENLIQMGLLKSTPRGMRNMWKSGTNGEMLSNLNEEGRTLSAPILEMV